MLCKTDWQKASHVLLKFYLSFKGLHHVLSTLSNVKLLAAIFVLKYPYLFH